MLALSIFISRIPGEGGALSISLFRILTSGHTFFTLTRGIFTWEGTSTSWSFSLFLFRHGHNTFMVTPNFLFSPPKYSWTTWESTIFRETHSMIHSLWRVSSTWLAGFIWIGARQTPYHPLLHNFLEAWLVGPFLFDADGYFGWFNGRWITTYLHLED